MEEKLKIEEETAAAAQRLKKGEEAADAAAARREMKDADEPDSRSSWSQWAGKQDGWKGKQGWNKQHMGKLLGGAVSRASKAACRAAAHSRDVCCGQHEPRSGAQRRAARSAVRVQYSTSSTSTCSRSGSVVLALV